MARGLTDALAFDGAEVGSPYEKCSLGISESNGAVTNEVVREGVFKVALRWSSYFPH